MIVDPFTGQPVESFGNAIAQPGSLPGNFGMSAAEAYGYDPGRNPVLFDFLQNLPGSTQMMGYNAWRGSRTIRRGGFSGHRFSISNLFGNKERGGNIIQGANNSFLNPRSWGRMRSGHTVAGGEGHYTPFGQLGHFSNKATNWAMNNFVAGRARTGQASGIGQRMLNAGLVDNNWTPGGKNPDYFWGGGVVSRMDASSRMFRNGRISGRRAAGFRNRGLKNAAKFIEDTDPSLYRAMQGSSIARSVTANNLGDLTLMSTRGTMSSAFSGYMSGAMNPAEMIRIPGTRTILPRAAMAGEDAIDEIAIKAGRQAFRTGRFASSEALARGGVLAGEKMGMRGAVKGFGMAFEEAGMGAAAKFGGAAAARAIGFALPGINVAMAAWTAYDVLKSAGALMGGALDLAKDAGLSLRGSISKPAFGMGYKDNTVAATSRARGVAAIQNSRLNARSVLGSEAPALASYFG